MNKNIISSLLHITKYRYICNICVLLLLYKAFPYIENFYTYLNSVLRYPYVWALTENETMLTIQAFISGGRPYTFGSGGEFLYFIYPPFFHLISSGFIVIFGYSILIPRLISLVSLGSLALLLILFYLKKNTRIEAVLVALVLLALSMSITTYSTYYVLARTEMFSMALGFWSIYFLWKITYCGKKTRINYIIAGSLGALALFTKQSTLYPYFTAALLLILVKDKKVWIQFIGGFALFTMMIFLVKNVATNNGFLEHMLMARTIYGVFLNSTDHLLMLQKIFIEQFWYLLVSAFVVSGISLYNLARKKRPAFSLIVLIAVYMNFLLTGGNRGAQFNTMLPLLFGILFLLRELYFYGKNSAVRDILSTCVIVLIYVHISVSVKFDYPYLVPTQADFDSQNNLIETLKMSKTHQVLGDRIDHAIILAGKKSLLEASTYNVARDWLPTKKYTTRTDSALLKKLKSNEIEYVVSSITLFGRGKLYDYATQEGKLVASYSIRYTDAPGIEHMIYQVSNEE